MELNKGRPEFTEERLKKILSTEISENIVHQRGEDSMVVMKLISFMAKRFVAGQTLPEATKVIGELNHNGLYTTFDHLGESVTNLYEARKATAIYLSMIDRLNQMDLDRNISVKLTQIGLDIDYNVCKENLEKILKKAKSEDTFVRVDMESSDYTTITLNLVEDLRRTHNNIGVVLQVMLNRTEDDVLKMIGAETSIRLCKGAYKEDKSIALQDMDEIRKRYISIAKRLLTSNLYHGIATHDDYIIDRIKEFAKEQMISKDAFEFQMLLGMRRKLQRQLVADGYRVRIYVPYGTHWLPYMLRRLRERKENVWFFVKNLFKE